MRFSLFAFVVVMSFASCKPKNKNDNTTVISTAVEDSYHTGTENVAVDGSFEPIVAEEAYVFKGIYTEAKLNLSYLTENEVLRKLLNDTVRVAVLSRELDSSETKILTKRTLPPETAEFAIDAVALIVNKTSNDTLITVSDIKKMLAGNTKTDKNIVFDNPNGSLVRYLKTFAGNAELKQKNIFALKSNKEVLNYVSSHKDAVGIIGFSWLNDPDADYKAAVDNVKIVAVKDDTGKTPGKAYYKPSQETLALKQYPLNRKLYIINCTSKLGLGRGFQDFLSSERGQRIILKSGLLPDSIPQRLINIKDN